MSEDNYGKWDNLMSAGEVEQTVRKAVKDVARAVLEWNEAHPDDKIKASIGGLVIG